MDLCESLTNKNNQMIQSSQARHTGNLRKFAAGLLILEIIIIVLYGVFVRYHIPASTESPSSYYPYYQDVNVMMLIGFGFLMTFVKNHCWGALSYTFMINAAVVQLYILLSAFWQRVLVEGFHGDNKEIHLQENSFTLASYCVASVLIAFGGVLGKVGPFQLLLMGVIQVIGYTLNEVIVYELIKVFDVGGSMAIHSFGAYFGLTVAIILAKKVKPVDKAPSSYNSNIFAMIGTLFLWMFWPSFNAGYFSATSYEKSQVVANTILSLTASCLGTFMMAGILKKKLSMQYILNATLAGGVMIGAPAGLLYHPGGALAIGLIAGVVSTLGYCYLTGYLEEKISLYDTCGIHNLHGLPGVMGGLASAAVVAAYTQPGTIDMAVTDPQYLTFYSSIHGGSFYAQGGLQVAGTFCSVGIGIFFGLIAGFTMRVFYKLQPQQFFRDAPFFEEAEEDELLENAKDVQIKLNTNPNANANETLAHLTNNA